MIKIGIGKFLKEVKQELGQVVWPKKEEAVKLTLAVIFVSVAVGVFISTIDYLLTKVMAVIIR